MFVEHTMKLGSSSMRLGWVVAVILGLAFPRPSLGQTTPKREWTAILLMSATYDDMHTKLSWTGSSDDVNVVVFHDQDGFGTVAYRMLPDISTANPPGECCPTEVDCCGFEDLPLDAMGLSSSDTIEEPGVLPKFLRYVANNFPANHYLISARGQMDGVRLLEHNGGGGLTIEQLETDLDGFNALTGKKVDVVNVGLCLGGVVDWAYALKDVADYYVGSPNFTNPPVSNRWRFYRWVRELIKTPTMAGRDLALVMPDIFAETTPDCVAAGDQCANTNPPNPSASPDEPEPWTCAAIDIAKLTEVANASSAFVCSIVPNFLTIESTYANAVNHSSVYGWLGGGMAEWSRLDLEYFAIRMRDALTDPTMKADADALAVAVEAAVIANQFQTRTSGGWFDGGDNAYGLSAIIPAGGTWGEYTPENHGPYQIDSLWQLLIQADSGGSTSTAAYVKTEPLNVVLPVGQTIEIIAKGSDVNSQPTCLGIIDWDTSGIASIGELVSDGNPAVFKADIPGTGVLKAVLGPLSATSYITVTKAPDPPPNPSEPSDSTVSGGCACVAAEGATSVLFGASLILVALGYRRRR